MTGMQLTEVMFVPNPSEDNGKHSVKPNYLNQCQSRLRKYQSDAMRDFADLLSISLSPTKQVLTVWKAQRCSLPSGKKCLTVQKPSINTLKQFGGLKKLFSLACYL